MIKKLKVVRKNPLLLVEIKNLLKRKSQQLEVTKKVNHLLLRKHLKMLKSSNLLKIVRKNLMQ